MSQYKILALILLLIAIAAFFGMKWNTYVAAGPSANASPVSSMTAKLPVVATKVYPKKWGAYVSPNAGSFSGFESLVGKSADMQAIFIGWGDFSDFSGYKNLALDGKTLVIFWEPNDLALSQIASGASDAYISSFAKATKDYAGPIILVPMPEMNGDWNSWSGAYGSNTPAQFIAAWQHMYNLFPKPSNVKFAWDVNSDSVPDTESNSIKNYYPGSDYVDYVGVDGFNFGDPWQSYSEIFSLALSQLKTYGKPIYIFSMACADGPQKPAWIADTFTQIKSDPRIVGWIWFDENKEKNWLVNSDQLSLQSFKNSMK